MKNREKRKKRVCITLPTKNEEMAISDVIRSIREVFDRTDYDEPIILITDDSKDRTRQIAAEQGAVVVNGGGRGLGYAMYRGLKTSLVYDPDYIISFDADGQSDPNEIMAFLKPLDEDQADLVIGSRFRDKGLIDYHYRWINRIGVIILSRILKSLTKLDITDSHGGIRAMRPEVVEELEMIGTHTYVQETIIDAVEKGFQVLEISSKWGERQHGGSRVVASIPTYVFYTLPILIIRSRQHIKWLYSTGIVFMMAAFAHFLFISWQASFQFKEMFQRLPSFLLIALLVLAGIQLFFFGFTIEMIKNIKYRLDRLDEIRDREKITSHFKPHEFGPSLVDPKSRASRNSLLSMRVRSIGSTKSDQIPGD
jgi:glycosyltransferase involved in cell wall biosynthesis